jgi:hypothetical protein
MRHQRIHPTSPPSSDHHETSGQRQSSHSVNSTPTGSLAASPSQNTPSVPFQQVSGGLMVLADASMSSSTLESESHSALPQQQNGTEQDSTTGGILDSIEPESDWTTFSDDFLQLLQTDSTTWPLALPLVQFSPASHFTAPPSTSEHHTNQVHVSETSRHAVNSLSEILKEMPAKLTEEVNSKRLSSRFFDDCLDLYFSRVAPAMPVLHRPTFCPSECSSALLLNIIALGSLFVGGSDAIAKVSMN